MSKPKTTDLIKRFNTLMEIGDKSYEHWAELFSIKGEVARRNWRAYKIVMSSLLGFFGVFALLSALGIRLP